MTTRPSETFSTLTNDACLGPQPATAAARSNPARRLFMTPLGACERTRLVTLDRQRTALRAGLRAAWFLAGLGAGAAVRWRRRCRGRGCDPLGLALLELLEAPRPILLEQARQAAIGEQPAL